MVLHLALFQNLISNFRSLWSFQILFISKYYVVEVHLLDNFCNFYQKAYTVPATQNIQASVVEVAP